MLLRQLPLEQNGTSAMEQAFFSLKTIILLFYILSGR